MLSPNRIDPYGVIWRGNDSIGYYDVVDKKCYDFNKVEIACPDMDSLTVINQPVIQSKQSYWWVLFVLFILIVVFLAWWFNR